MSTTVSRLVSSNCPRLAPVLALFVAMLSLVGLTLRPQPTFAKPVAPQQASECQGGVGGRLFSIGGQVEVEMLQSDAGFTIELHLVSPGPDRLIATNREPGTITRLGAFDAGTELIFGVYVRETQQRYVMGSGSGNADGIPHAELNCFNGRRANVGFEDQLGGGDRDYNDLLCTVRQTEACAYSVSPTSQSFDWRGGAGNLNVTPSGGCSWTAVSNASWIVITSGGAGSSIGKLNYSVAANNDDRSRSSTIGVQGQTFTVNQDGIGGQPLITSAIRDGKRLYVYGINFDDSSVILLNGDTEKTKRDSDNPTTVLIAKKAGKRVRPGDILRVQKSSGATSPGYIYTP